MKKILIIFLVICSSSYSHAQSLEGLWKGKYTVTEMQIAPVVKTYNKQIPINLYFTLLKDSSYYVTSFSQGFNKYGQDTIVTCRVSYKLLEQDSIYLEEKEVILPKNSPNIGFQNMRLRIDRRKDKTFLVGKWTYRTLLNDEGGEIIFLKSMESVKKQTRAQTFFLDTQSF